MWSKSTVFTTVQSASNTFTASSRPPNPTSSTATSTFERMKMSIAASVPNSKYVSESGARAPFDATE
jgi:hypothetical protein